MVTDQSTDWFNKYQLKWSVTMGYGFHYQLLSCSPFEHCYRSKTVFCPLFRLSLYCLVDTFIKMSKNQVYYFLDTHKTLRKKEAFLPLNSNAVTGIWHKQMQVSVQLMATYSTSNNPSLFCLNAKYMRDSRFAGVPKIVHNVIIIAIRISSPG